MVRPTEVGDVFLASANRLINDLDLLLQDIGNVARSKRGRVVVTCLPSIAGRVMPDAIRECARTYPAVEIDIRDDSANQLLEVVRYGEADLGVTMQWEDPHEELIFEPLLDDSYHLVCSKDHRLARKKQVTWVDLAGEVFIAFTTAGGSHTMIKDALVRNGVTLKRSIAVSQLATVHLLLEGGLGISVLPRLGLPIEKHPTLVNRPISRPALKRTLGIIRRKDRSLSPAASGFSEILRDVMRLEGGTRAQM